MKKSIFTLCYFFFVGMAAAFSQDDFTKKATFGSIGISSSTNWMTDGLGVSVGIGSQKAAWKNDRLRIVPSLNFGIYSNFGTTDVASTQFSSTSLKYNLNFDILKIKSFSVFLGTGLTANYTIGNRKAGVGLSGQIAARNFNKAHFAFNALLGFRLNPKEKRVGYELLLLNGVIGITEEYFSELAIFQFRIFVKQLAVRKKLRYTDGGFGV